MATKELKQIWNSAVAVAVAIATIAAVVTVAILEQRQRKFRAGYLQNCNLQFPNLTYARPRLSFTLIFNYKRSTHHKEAAFVRGSQVLGIIPRVLKPLGSLSDSLTGEELVVSGDLATLEALITLASWAHLHIHQKPIGLLNINNFYDGFIAFLNHAIKNYFTPTNAKKNFICAHTANELLDLLQAYRPEPDPWTFVLERPNNDGNSSCSKKYKLNLTLRQ
ncbi:hypothetical protein WN943_019375 [Citrus x changshan-huyou]